MTTIKKLRLILDGRVFLLALPSKIEETKLYFLDAIFIKISLGPVNIHSSLVYSMAIGEKTI